MILGFISDLHGNLPALEEVLSDVEGKQVDVLICLGDLVGYGAEPNEVVELASEKCELSLVGNHDLAAIGRLDIATFNSFARASAHWTSNELTDPTVQVLSSLRPQRDVLGVSLAHGSPRDPVSEYVRTADVAAHNFALRSFDIAIVGHTHIPAVFSLAGQFVTGEDLNEGAVNISPRAILNPGSVGQPRDGDPRASWGTFDSETSVFRVHRVEYDIGREQASIRSAGLPEVLATRLEEGR